MDILEMTRFGVERSTVMVRVRAQLGLGYSNTEWVRTL